MMSAVTRGRGLTRRVTLSIIGLTIASLVIFAAITTMFIGVRTRERSIEESIRENGMWSAYQADREANRFVEYILRAIKAPGDAALDALGERYDILYSRASIVSKINFSSEGGQQVQMGPAAHEVSDAIMAIAPAVDALLATRDNLDTVLPRLLRQAEDLRKLTETFVLESNRRSNETRVEERRVIQGTYETIAFGVLILTLALMLVVGLLIAQIVHISRTGRRLEELSERNARAAEAAEAGTRAKSAFLASMSHEIRTPLNGIIGMAENLEATPLLPEQSEQIDIIRRSGDLLLDVINDILDFSKVESGMVEITPVEFNLRELLESLETVMSPRASGKGLALMIHAPAYMITCDPARLRQVLINLVGNAIKFTDSGSIEVEARMSGPGRMRFGVTDTGMGISRDSLPSLFKEFSQVDSSITRRFGGTGLGLAICKRLIIAMGGEVGVESVVGKGSEFWFELPVGEPRPAVATSAVVSSASGFSGNVLVVEDNAINQKVVVGLLDHMGLAVECVGNGAEALEELGHRRFDLILMDIQMPVLDGLAATRAIRARGDRTPIVGLTANAFVSDREACFAAGMDGFMSKPVTRAKLSETIAPWLDAARVAGPAKVAREEPVARPPAIDMAYREVLIREIGAETVHGLIADFAVDAVSLVEKARKALAAGDPTTVDRTLHSLKGAAQTLGFAEIGRHAQEGRTDCIDDLYFDQLEQMIRSIRPAGSSEDAANAA